MSWGFPKTCARICIRYVLTALVHHIIVACVCLRSSKGQVLLFSLAQLDFFLFIKILQANLLNVEKLQEAAFHLVLTIPRTGKCQRCLPWAQLWAKETEGLDWLIPVDLSCAHDKVRRPAGIHSIPILLPILPSDFISKCKVAKNQIEAGHKIQVLGSMHQQILI